MDVALEVECTIAEYQACEPMETVKVLDEFEDDDDRWADDYDWESRHEN